MKFQGLLLAAVLGTSAYAGNNHEVGNGGDGLRKIFRDAKNLASGLVKGITPCGLNGTAEVNKWIEENRVALAEDILASEHKWVVDSQETCAFTTYDKKAPLYLSYEQCGETTRDEQDAMYVVIHESIHHLGVRDNTMVDNIVETIMRAEQRECPDTPLAAYFELDICPGERTMDSETFLSYFKTATSHAEYGTMRHFVRRRICHEQTGCLDWQYVKAGESDIDLHISSSGEHYIWSYGPKSMDFGGGATVDIGPADSWISRDSGMQQNFKLDGLGDYYAPTDLSLVYNNSLKINKECAYYYFRASWSRREDSQYYDQYNFVGYSGDR